MSVFNDEISLDTKGEMDIIDITGEVKAIIKKSKIKDGIVCVFVVGSTGALTTIEYEPGLKKDFSELLERLVPKNKVYAHNERWHDGNGHSHIRASLIGPSFSAPIQNNKIILGTWQQIIFIELDVRPRHRRIIAQIVGD
jgi:secondary thiamine-phosphate synthase enzyme